MDLRYMYRHVDGLGENKLIWIEKKPHQNMNYMVKCSFSTIYN